MSKPDGTQPWPAHEVDIGIVKLSIDGDAATAVSGWEDVPYESGTPLRILWRSADPTPADKLTDEQKRIARAFGLG